MAAAVTALAVTLDARQIRVVVANCRPAAVAQMRVVDVRPLRHAVVKWLLVSQAAVVRLPVPILADAVLVRPAAARWQHVAAVLPPAVAKFLLATPVVARRPVASRCSSFSRSLSTKSVRCSAAEAIATAAATTVAALNPPVAVKWLHVDVPMPVHPAVVARLPLAIPAADATAAVDVARVPDCWASSSSARTTAAVTADAVQHLLADAKFPAAAAAAPRVQLPLQAATQHQHLRHRS